MNPKILIPILIGIAVIVSLASMYSQSEPMPVPSYEIDFTYSDVHKIQEILAMQNIRMSSPTEIKDHTVSQYCMFFDGNTQKFVKYCITTALMTSDGNPLGNLNMGGSSNTPVMALALVESHRLLDSRVSEIDFIFQTMIETLVCDCWDEKQPGGFESVKLWLDAAEKQYLESGETTIKSTIDGLDEKQIILEITVTEKSYLWTLIVTK